MGIWQRLFGDPPAPEPVPEPDDGLLDRSVSTLAEHGFTPCGEIVVPDEAAFRRRPLTTLLCLVADGRPLFPRVFIDVDELSRTSSTSLPGFVLCAAEHAGTAGEVRNVRVMCDPGSRTTGSLRYTRGWTVLDHSFDFGDTGDTGDAVVEDDILQGVAPAGYDAFTFYAEPTLTPITLWLGADTDDTLIDALLAENARVTEPAE